MMKREDSKDTESRHRKFIKLRKMELYKQDRKSKGLRELDIESEYRIDHRNSIHAR